MVPAWAWRRDGAGGGAGCGGVDLAATPAYERPFLLPPTVQGAVAGGGESSLDDTAIGSWAASPKETTGG